MSRSLGVGWLLSVLLVTAQASQPSSGRQISGRVMDEGFQPLANAKVFLHPRPYPPGSRPASTVTNGDGDYSFRNLEAGAYHLGTNKLGYLPTSGGEKLITLTGPNEQVNLDLMMSKGGTLAGRVVDQSGKPLKNIWVYALRRVGSPGLEDAEPSITTARSNDRGEYRVESLKPGAHVVVARTVTDSRTFFPGTLDFARAQWIQVGSAETIAGLDFGLLEAPGFDVSGIAVDETGRAIPDARVALDADWSKFGGPKSATFTDRGGRFLVSRVVPGRYMLTVTRPGVQAKPVTRDTPFVRVDVVDAAIEGLVVPVPIR